MICKKKYTERKENDEKTQVEHLTTRWSQHFMLSTNAVFIFLSDLDAIYLLKIAPASCNFPEWKSVVITRHQCIQKKVLLSLYTRDTVKGKKWGGLSNGCWGSVFKGAWGEGVGGGVGRELCLRIASRGF